MSSARMLLLSVLKNLLEQAGLPYTFEELLRLIRGGVLQKAVYPYPGFKNYQLYRTLDISAELAQILHFMKIKTEYFAIEEYRL